MTLLEVCVVIFDLIDQTLDFALIFVHEVCLLFKVNNFTFDAGKTAAQHATASSCGDYSDVRHDYSANRSKQSTSDPNN